MFAAVRREDVSLTYTQSRLYIYIINECACVHVVDILLMPASAGAEHAMLSYGLAPSLSVSGCSVNGGDQRAILVFARWFDDGLQLGYREVWLSQKHGYGSQQKSNAWKLDRATGLHLLPACRPQGLPTTFSVRLRVQIQRDSNHLSYQRPAVRSAE